MLVVDLRNTRINVYNYSVVGNKNSDIIYFYYPKKYQDYDVYIKVLGQNIADKFRIYTPNIEVKDDCIRAKWIMPQSVTVNKEIQVQLEYDITLLGGGEIAQSKIVTLKLQNTLDIEGSVEPVYPTILQELREDLDAEILHRQQGDTALHNEIVAEQERAEGVEAGLQTAINGKVDKVAGKGLSTNDFTNEEKNKLAGIEGGAQANVLEGVKVNNEALTPTNKVVNIDLTSYAKIVDMETYAKSLTVEINSSTYVMTFTLKDKNGNTLNTQTVDLPLETMVVGGSYDAVNKAIILTLKNGQTISIPVADLVDGLVSETQLQTVLTNYYTASQVDTALNLKADKATTYTKTETDTLLNAKENSANKVTVIDEANPNDTEYPSEKAVVDYVKKETQEASIDVDFTGTLKYSGVSDNLAIPKKSQVEFKKILANAYQYNQLIETLPATTTLTGVTFTNNNNGTVTVSGQTDSVSQYIIWANRTGKRLIVGHKYALFGVSNANVSNLYLRLRTFTPSQAERQTARVNSGSDIAFLTYGEDDYGAVIDIVDENRSVVVSNAIFKPQIMDLTASGMDNLTTADQVKAELLRRGIDIEQYNEYSAGKLINTNLTKYKVTGVNLWDEIIQTGYYSVADGSYVENGTYLCSKNDIKVKGGEKYYFKVGQVTGQEINLCMCWYDGDGNYIGYNSQHDVEVTAPENARIGRFYLANNAYGTVYRHDICINISNASINGQYFPYEETEYPINFNGKSAGTAHDTKDKNGLEITRVGSVDLGSLNWSYNGSVRLFNASLTDGKTTLNLLTPLYTPYELSGSGNDPDKCIFIYNGTVYITNSDYTDSSSFKTAMSGVPLYYELKTPTEEQGEPLPIPAVEFGGSEEQIYEGCPATITENYDISIKDQVLTNVEVDRKQEVDIQKIKDSKITSWGSNPTDEQLPSAKLVKDTLGDYARKDQDNYFSVKQHIEGNDDTPLVLVANHSSMANIQFVKKYNGQATNIGNIGVNGYAPYFWSQNSDVQQSGQLLIDSDLDEINDLLAELKTIVYDNQYPAVAEIDLTYATYYALPSQISGDKIIMSAGMDMTKVKGRSYVVNQIFNYTRSAERKGVLCQSVSGLVTITGTSSESGNGGTFSWTDFVIPIGHKVIVLKDFNLPEGSYLFDQYNIDGGDMYDITQRVVTIVSGYLILQLRIGGVGVTYNIVDKHIFVVDLTQWFGSNDAIPADLLADPSLFTKKYWKKSLPYDTGHIEDSKPVKVIATGFNKWDEEYESGTFYSNGNFNNSDSQIRSKNYIKVVSNTTYYVKAVGSGVVIIQYDKDKNFISSLYRGNETFTVDSNCEYIKFGTLGTYGTTYNHDICINISDPLLNGKYLPYQKNEYPIIPIDMGTYTFTGNETGDMIASGAFIFSTISGFSNIVKSPAHSQIANASMSCGLEASSYNVAWNKDKSFFIDGGTLHFKDNRFASWADLMAFLAGTTITFELATQSHNPLRSAGSVQDDNEKARVGVVTINAENVVLLGTSGGTNIRQAVTNIVITDAIATSAIDVSAQGIASNGYIVQRRGGYWTSDLAIQIENNEAISIANSALNTLEDFKALCPITVRYKLATPTDQSPAITLPENIEIQKGGTIEIEYDDGYSTPCDANFEVAVSKVLEE